jgi:micrococcal nuclease
VVVPVEQDRYGRTAAEIFVPMAGTKEDIHVNTQMVLDGMAYHYALYSGGCPNGMLLNGAEDRAKVERVEVWSKVGAVKLWDWRQNQ